VREPWLVDLYEPICSSYSYIPEPALCGQMQRRVALVIVVWVAEPLGVVAYYALD
jgi:hypothetical protein